MANETPIKNENAKPDIKIPELKSNRPAGNGGIEIKIPMEELRKRKLFLAAPMYGGQCFGTFARSVADLSAVCTRYGVQLQIYFLFNESLITRARNYCCDEFMRSDATHMLFVDSDIGFNPEDVIAMLALQSDESDYDVIGGPYPKKCIPWEKIKVAVDKGFADDNPNALERFTGDFVFNPVNGSGSIPIHQPAEVMEIGTGFMMIRRKTLEVFQEKYPHLYYKPDHVRTEHFDGSREIMSYFDCIVDRGYNYGDLQKAINEECDPAAKVEKLKSLIGKEKTSSKRYLSEDYLFCQMARAAGLKVWLCGWMKLSHSGTFVWNSALVDLAALGVSATADVGELKKIKDFEKRQRK
jgi:hypothetical protein